MTDRIKGLTVSLEPNIREDDAETIINAIKMIRGVNGVETHVADIDHYMAVQTFRHDIGSKIIDIIFDRDKRK